VRFCSGSISPAGNERCINARDGESAGTARFIDTYHRGCFICEAKSFDLGKNTETAAPA
jgi:hypothetical protein